MSVQVETGSTTGPASYATGGFVITTTLSTVNAFDVCITTADSDLTSFRPVFTRNSPGAGQVTVKLMRKQYDKLTDIGAVSGLPAGVSAAATSGQTYDADTTHVHSMAHDHAAATSGTMTGPSGGALLDAVGSKDILLHTHSFDPPNFTGNTGVGSSHSHTWDNIYEHQHSTTNTETTASLSEVPNTTDLSGATFLWMGIK